MTRFLDRAKAAAEQAAAKMKDEAKELQTKRELGQAYDELGRTAFELIETGGLSNGRLAPIADRIRSLEAQLAAERAEPEPTSTERPASDQPPAMPT